MADGVSGIVNVEVVVHAVHVIESTGSGLVAEVANAGAEAGSGERGLDGCWPHEGEVALEDDVEVLRGVIGSFRQFQDDGGHAQSDGVGIGVALEREHGIWMERMDGAASTDGLKA